MSAVPAVIQRFIDTTNAGDTPGFLACFTEDAFLSDWGRDFSGHAGIADWNQTDNIGQASHFRPVSVEGAGQSFKVRMAVTGRGFNGEGDLVFTLKGDRIARLVIS